jgi:hypothetical protein
VKEKRPVLGDPITIKVRVGNRSACGGGGVQEIFDSMTLSDKAAAFESMTFRLQKDVKEKLSPC